MSEINFQNFTRKNIDSIIKKISQKEDGLLDEKEEIIQFFSIKNYGLKKKVIDIIFKELPNYKLSKTLECLILINIGYVNSIEETKASIDFLNFIINQIEKEGKSRQYGIISLYLFLLHHSKYESSINGHNNYNFHLILKELDKAKQLNLLNVIIEGIIKNEEIYESIGNFFDKILKYIPSKYSSSKKLTYNMLFDVVFKNKPELLKLFKDSLYIFLKNNLDEIFQKDNVFTVFKHVYVDLYNEDEEIFTLLNNFLDKNLSDKKHLSKIVSLISNFMVHHWSHPFFRKHCEKYFQLLYKLKENWDIENLGTLLYHFKLGSLTLKETEKIINNRLFEKALEDFEIVYRSNESNMFNIAYQNLEKFVKEKIKKEDIIESQENEKVKINAHLERWSRLLSKSPKEIQRWLDNFQPEEQYFAKKMLDRIRYIHNEELGKICKELYTKLLEVLPRSRDDFLFVSLGGEAKSNKLISYHFRTNNGLPEEIFINPLDSKLKEIRKKIIIYLDDVAGTGRQLYEDWNNFKERLDPD